MSEEPSSSSSSSSSTEQDPPQTEDQPQPQPDQPQETQEQTNEPVPPEKEVHKFKFVLKNIQIYGVLPFDAVTSDPFLYFTLGGNFKVQDLRHRFDFPSIILHLF